MLGERVSNYAQGGGGGRGLACMSHKEWLSALDVNGNKMIMFSGNNRDHYLFEEHSDVKGKRPILCCCTF